MTRTIATIDATGMRYEWLAELGALCESCVGGGVSKSAGPSSCVTVAGRVGGFIIAIG